jgi:S-adenosylmethionine:tRNA ribosyltransferase-isomerase
MDTVQYKKSDFYYYLPESQIAQTPAEPRDSSRLLVYNREKDQVEHVIFHDVVNYLKAGDVLVVNNTKVLPARLYAHTPNGGVVEVLLLKRIDKDTWEVLVKPGKKCKIGKTFNIGDKLSFTVTDITDSGERIVKFSYDGVFEEILDEVGSMPLPPYIKEKLKDKDRYQTVYAKTEGSAAAPTAGLHFTPQLLQKIKDMGVEVVEVLLHVGLGTFRPVKEDIITDHKMHSEYYEVSEKAASVVNKAKSEGRRIIAVGTTSVRTLESATDESGVLHSGSGNTQIFIYPPYKFKCVDALITNFHLPESTLIMLVAALVGREKILSLYDLAVREKYRFFSFGDAMFIV